MRIPTKNPLSAKAEFYVFRDFYLPEKLPVQLPMFNVPSIPTIRHRDPLTTGVNLEFSLE